MEKGQKEELLFFADAIQQNGIWPIPLWQQIQATQISLLIEEQLKIKETVSGCITAKV
jgi:hypothetical protein